jgi:hypothetical protein
LHSDDGNDSDSYLDGASALEELLATNGVHIVFNGHSHVYERNIPQIPDTPMVSYISGNGGAEVEPITRCSAFDAYALGSGSSCNAPVPTSDAQVYGFLQVTVDGTRVTVNPINEQGASFDVQTYDFASLQPTSP